MNKNHYSSLQSIKTFGLKATKINDFNFPMDYL